MGQCSKKSVCNPKNSYKYTKYEYFLENLLLLFLLDSGYLRGYKCVISILQRSMLFDIPSLTDFKKGGSKITLRLAEPILMRFSDLREGFREIIRFNKKWKL